MPFNEIDQSVLITFENWWFTLSQRNGESRKGLLLSTEQEIAILKRTDNIKHRAIIMTIYSAGLRISEAVQLKIKDIVSHRMQIRVQQSKGKKRQVHPAFTENPGNIKNLLLGIQTKRMAN